MILALGTRSQVRTLQEGQVSKALKVAASERVRIILSCLRGVRFFFGKKKQKAFFTKKPMTLGVARLRPHLVIGTFWGLDYYSSSLKRLISQSFSAFSASSLKNVSAVSGSHSFSKAVLFFSLSFLRLICSEHYCHLLGICSEACCFSAFFTLLHNDIIYYKHKRGNLSSLF